MHTDINDRVAVERRLWEEIEKHQTGMLGVTGGAPHHTQPMTAFVEPERRQIWFFTRTDTDLAREIAEGRTAMFVFQQKDIQACIAGELTLQHDPARIEKYWNAEPRNNASSAAKMMSAVEATIQPPKMQWPCTAQIIGLLMLRQRRCMSTYSRHDRSKMPRVPSSIG